MSQTPRLTLPLIQPAQAQKHITHNEALALLDSLTQLTIVTLAQDTPPEVVQDGDVYGVGAAPVGVWAGQAGMLAVYNAGGWTFVPPQPGWRAWDQSSTQLVIYTGAAWQVYLSELQNLSSVGIGTGADDINRLVVAAPASLFTHEGHGHQIKVNKAAAGDTASLLFQSNWNGHAEMGLAGDTAFSVKISADGANWVTALRADAGQGDVRIDLRVTGQAVQQSADDITAGRLMRADWGYGPGNLVGNVTMNGAVPSGAVIERGDTANGSYVRWADGTQICWAEVVLTLFDTSTLEANWSFPAAFVHHPFTSISLRDETEVSITPRKLCGPFAAQAPGGARLRLYAASSASGFPANSSAMARVMAVGRWV